MADSVLVFAFDSKLDHPIHGVDMPTAVRDRFADAAFAALRKTYEVAEQRNAMAVVLFGTILDPSTASPAQARSLAAAIEGFAATGGTTVCVTDDVAFAQRLVTALGEPPGLRIVSNRAPLTIDVGVHRVELSCHGSRQISVTWRQLSDDGDAMRAGRLYDRILERFDVFGLRGDELPTDAETSGGRVLSLGTIQPRGRHESSAGRVGLLRFSWLTAAASDWETIPVAAVNWREVRTVCSANEGPQELAATAWAEVESAVAADSRQTIVSLTVDCEGDVSRRVRLARITPSVLTEIRSLLSAHSGAWCDSVEADPHESLERLITDTHSAGNRRFSAMLASAADDRERSEVSPHPHRQTGIREAAWMALELLESD